LEVSAKKLTHAKFLADGVTMQELSKRERQIMDVIFRLGKASAADILTELPDAPSNSTVRTLLRILEDKGQLQHEMAGKSYVYFPTMEPEKASKRALGDVIKTFFSGSVEKTVATLIDMSEEQLSDQKLDALADMIEAARKKGK
jgi:predicted transcriptional regulator